MTFAITLFKISSTLCCQNFGIALFWEKMFFSNMLIYIFHNILLYFHLHSLKLQLLNKVSFIFMGKLRLCDFQHLIVPDEAHITVCLDVSYTQPFKYCNFLFNAWDGSTTLWQLLPVTSIVLPAHS